MEDSESVQDSSSRPHTGKSILHHNTIDCFVDKVYGVDVYGKIGNRSQYHERAESYKDKWRRYMSHKTVIDKYMIRYYAYYNHGGYKDLYLGSNADEVECRFFLPMMAIFETDESMKSVVEEWKKLSQIVYLSSSTTDYNYPSEARVMMSHSGYKLQYRIIGGEDVLAIRDISGNKDVYGRSCPFVFMFIADTEEDKLSLKKAANFFWTHLKESESFFSGLFVNDFNVNGLRFEVKRLNEYFENTILVKEETLEENKYKRSVVFYVVPDGCVFQDAFKEQNITSDDVSLAYNESKTSVHRYSPPQVVYGTTGTPPIILQQTQEESVDRQMPKQNAEEENKNMSLRNLLGLTKEEDFIELLESHHKLQEQVASLEQRIIELEKNIQI